MLSRTPQEHPTNVPKVQSDPESFPASSAALQAIRAPKELTLEPLHGDDTGLPINPPYDWQQARPYTTLLACNGELFIFQPAYWSGNLFVAHGRHGAQEKECQLANNICLCLTMGRFSG